MIDVQGNFLFACKAFAGGLAIYNCRNDFEEAYALYHGEDYTHDSYNGKPLSKNAASSLNNFMRYTTLFLDCSLIGFAIINLFTCSTPLFFASLALTKLCTVALKKSAHYYVDCCKSSVILNQQNSLIKSYNNRFPSESILCLLPAVVTSVIISNELPLIGTLLSAVTTNYLPEVASTFGSSLFYAAPLFSTPLIGLLSSVAIGFFVLETINFIETYNAQFPKSITLIEAERLLECFAQR